MTAPVDCNVFYVQMSELLSTNEETSNSASLNPNFGKRRRSEKKEERESGWSRCMFLIVRKNRYCNIPRKGDSLFCAHHNEEHLGERTPCPVDPSHTIWKADLKAHVLRCATVKHDKERREQPYFSEGVNGGEAPPEEAQAIASMYSRVADAVKGEGCEGEDNGEGALEHKVARGGMLSYLFRVQSDLGLNIEALAHRLLHWTSAQGEGFIQESFLVHEESLPFLRVALAPHCSSSSNTEATTTTTNNNTKQMEEEAIAKALESGSSSNCFRHELQQSSIITNILLAVQRARREDSRVGGSAPPAAGVGAGGDKKVARKEEREEQLAPPPPTPPPSFAGARVIETQELPRSERVKAPPLFVEFGAGRGMLSATLASLMDPCNMLLI